MIVSYDEYLVPTYKLNKAETEELEQTGFIIDDEEGVVITKLGNQYTVAKITANYESIKLTY